MGTSFEKPAQPRLIVDHGADPNALTAMLSDPSIVPVTNREKWGNMVRACRTLSERLSDGQSVVIGLQPTRHRETSAQSLFATVAVRDGKTRDKFLGAVPLGGTHDELPGTPDKIATMDQALKRTIAVLRALTRPQ
jgi:hypothetical protein